MVEVLSFDPPALFAPSIEGLCQLATEATGNTDTSSLKELLELFDVTIENYIISSANIVESIEDIRIGLIKTDMNISEDILNILALDQIPRHILI